MAGYDPTTDKISRRRVAGGDAAGLIALIGEARRRAEQRADGPVGAECVFEAGYGSLSRTVVASVLGIRRIEVEPIARGKVQLSASDWRKLAEVSTQQQG